MKKSRFFIMNNNRQIVILILSSPRMFTCIIPTSNLPSSNHTRPMPKHSRNEPRIVNNQISSTLKNRDYPNFLEENLRIFTNLRRKDVFSFHFFYQKIFFIPVIIKYRSKHGNRQRERTYNRLRLAPDILCRIRLLFPVKFDFSSSFSISRERLTTSNPT